MTVLTFGKVKFQSALECVGVYYYFVKKEPKNEELLNLSCPLQVFSHYGILEQFWKNSNGWRLGSKVFTFWRSGFLLQANKIFFSAHTRCYDIIICQKW